jgi:hypothetical protein
MSECDACCITVAFIESAHYRELLTKHKGGRRRGDFFCPVHPNIAYTKPSLSLFRSLYWGECPFCAHPSVAGSQHPPFIPTRFFIYCFVLFMTGVHVRGLYVCRVWDHPVHPECHPANSRFPKCSLAELTTEWIWNFGYVEMFSHFLSFELLAYTWTNKVKWKETTNILLLHQEK